MPWLILKEYDARLAGRIIYGWTLNGTPTQPNYLRRYCTGQNALLFFAIFLIIFVFSWTVSYCLALCGLGQLPFKNKRIYNWLTAYLQDKGGLDKRELELFSYELTFKFNFV